MCRSSQSHRLAAVAVLMASVGLIVTGSGSPAFAQGYDTWSKVESSQETREYGQQIRAGTFEAAQRAVVKGIILPQLALEANRATIVQVRQRMRDLITRGTTAPGVFDAVNKVTLEYMEGLAKDEKQDLIVRVNAIILIGELLAADRKPWVGSVQSLAEAAGNGNLPLAVRIAAINGLARHVAEGRGRGTDRAFAQDVWPAVASLITSPPEGEATAVNWIVGRALEIAPITGGTPETMTAVVKILSDDAADLELRLRAAATLGRLAKPEDAAILAPALGHFRTVAVLALERDLAAADDRRFQRKLRTFGQEAPAAQPTVSISPPPQPPPPDDGGGLFGPVGPVVGSGGESPIFQAPLDPDAVPLLACRRDAWRLMMLANALKPDGSGPGGLASALSGDSAAEALELATTLRRESLAIAAQPEEATIKAAATALGPSKKPAAGGNPLPVGKAGAEEPSGSPFGGPGESSSPF